MWVIKKHYQPSAHLVVAKKEKQKELFEKITEGRNKVEGVVKNVTDFCTFIDLGEQTTFHISGMSWGRVENSKKVFQYWR